MCPKCDQTQICAQNVPKLVNYAQKVSKLLTVVWTITARCSKYVLMARKCPKCVHNVPKLRARRGYNLYRSCLRINALVCFCGCVRAAHADMLERPYRIQVSRRCQVCFKANHYFYFYGNAKSIIMICMLWNFNGAGTFRDMATLIWLFWIPWKINIIFSGLKLS